MSIHITSAECLDVFRNLQFLSILELQLVGKQAQTRWVQIS
jgi:hypothetical protein